MDFDAWFMILIAFAPTKLQLKYNYQLLHVHLGQLINRQ